MSRLSAYSFSLLAAVLAIFVTTESMAAGPNQFTGVQLIKYCNQSNFAAMKSGVQGPEDIGTVICAEYVSGVLQGFKLGQLEMVAEIADAEDQYLNDISAKEKLKITDADRTAFINKIRMQNAHWLCWPTSANGGQLLDIVAKYLQDHPEELNEPSATLVYEAIHEAFKNEKC